MSLTERELQKMRSAQEKFFPDVCTVKRPTQTTNIAGSQTTTWVNVYTDLPCEVSAKVLRQIIEHVGGGSIQSAVRWNITMPYGTVIQLDDEIFTGGEKYIVNGMQSVESFETAVVAQCLRVE